MILKSKRQARAGLSEALHSSAEALHRVGALDKATMRDFEARHLIVARKSAAKRGKVRKSAPT